MESGLWAPAGPSRYRGPPLSTWAAKDSCGVRSGCQGSSGPATTRTTHHVSWPAGVRAQLCLATGPELFDDVLERRDDLVLLDARLLEAQSKVEGLGGRLEREDEVFRTTGFGLGGFPADRFTGGRALAGQLLDQRDHL